jgi:hypothetical protein
LGFLIALFSRSLQPLACLASIAANSLAIPVQNSEVVLCFDVSVLCSASIPKCRRSRIGFHTLSQVIGQAKIELRLDMTSTRCSEKPRHGLFLVYSSTPSLKVCHAEVVLRMDVSRTG